MIKIKTYITDTFKKIAVLATLLGTFGVSLGANAIIIDFDGLSSSEVLDEQYASLGVHFSAYENGLAVGSIAGTSLTGTYDTPSNVWSNCYPSICSSRADVLRIDFDMSVENLQWYTDTAGSLQPTFNAYDIDGILLETVFATATSETVYALSSFSSSGIAAVELLQPSDNWGYYIDTISFDVASVPEPSVLALLAIGLVGVGFTKRRT